MNLITTFEQHIVPYLVRDYANRRVVERAQRAYAIFSTRHPLWADTLHDERFFMQGVTSLLADGRIDRCDLDPAALARAWADRMWYRDEAMRRRIVTTLMPAAITYVALLQDQADDANTGLNVDVKCREN